MDTNIIFLYKSFSSIDLLAIIAEIEANFLDFFSLYILKRREGCKKPQKSQLIEVTCSQNREHTSIFRYFCCVWCLLHFCLISKARGEKVAKIVTLKGFPTIKVRFSSRRIISGLIYCRKPHFSVSSDPVEPRAQEPYQHLVLHFTILNYHTQVKTHVIYSYTHILINRSVFVMTQFFSMGVALTFGSTLQKFQCKKNWSVTQYFMYEKKKSSVAISVHRIPTFYDQFNNCN
jgi:hypothetical protein